MDNYLNFPVVQQILPPIVANVQNMNNQLRSKVPAFQLNRRKSNKTLTSTKHYLLYELFQSIKSLFSIVWFNTFAFGFSDQYRYSIITIFANYGELFS